MTPPHGAFRWGILGTGTIATAFARALRHVADAELVAVGSRTQDGADAFAAAQEVPRAHGSYEELVADDDVDVVYVATPNARHCADTILSLEAGKHVLCEKPFALNVAETARVVELARERDRFVMEALWSRFLPAYRTLRELLDAEALGEVLHVEGSFGFRADAVPTHRLFDLALGGGALLDLGVYPVHLAHFVLGTPTSVTALGRLGRTGVDEDTVVTMSFANGALAYAQAAIRTPLVCSARVIGSAGTVELPEFMHCPDHLDVRVAGDVRRIETPLGDAPLAFQVKEVHECLRAGRRESAVMPLADTCAVADTLDRARAAIGLRYPGEA
jgi:predicted dehydrogenase